MKLTTKGRFAVTAMADLALQPLTEPVTLAEISERQKISLSYLEQLFSKLRRNALVDSVRGPGGGYRLARPTAEISIADIVQAVDEPIDTTQCKGRENCRGDRKCLTHDLWSSLNAHILQYLAGTTLRDVVDRELARRKAEPRVVAMPETRVPAL